MSDELQDQIEQQASEPVSGTNDGQSFTQRSLKDLIEADRYLKSAAASKSKSRGIRYSKLKPPGTT